MHRRAPPVTTRPAYQHRLNRNQISRLIQMIRDSRTLRRDSLEEDKPVVQQTSARRLTGIEKFVPGAVPIEEGEAHVDGRAKSRQ